MFSAPRSRSTAANAVYGVFGDIMALLLWIYLSGCVFIFGACLCAARGAQAGAEDENAAGQTDPKQQGHDVAEDAIDRVRRRAPTARGGEHFRALSLARRGAPDLGEPRAPAGREAIEQ